MPKKTTDQVLNTVALIANQLCREARKDPKVALIVVYGKKADDRCLSYYDASTKNAFTTIMELLGHCGCSRDEMDTVAKEIGKGLERKFNPPPQEEYRRPV